MQKTSIVRVATLLFCLLLAVPVQAQKEENESSFVRNQNGDFVYLRFDHVGKGAPRNQDEPSLRIWLRFVNNCNVPIRLHTYGMSEGGLLTGEVGVMDDVIPDQPKLTIISDTPQINTKYESGSVRKQGEATRQQNKMPTGYLDEVSGVLTVAPGNSVLFSVPVDHLGSPSEPWHMQIPFWFAVPPSHVPRNPMVGGEPVMSLWYSFNDLPSKVQAEIAKQN